MPFKQATNTKNISEFTPGIEELFQHYKELAKQLGECDSGRKVDGSDEHADNVLAAQSKIIQEAASAPATNIQDVMLKWQSGVRMRPIWRR